MLAMDIDRLKCRIRAVIDTRTNVVLLYLFGSQVDGEIGPLSDIDLAVLFTPGAPIASTRSQRASAFSAALAGERVDLIVLNHAPVELAHAIIAQGQVVFRRDLAARVEYEADVMSRYGDYLPFLQAQRQSIVRGADDERRIQRYREALGRIERALGTSGP